MTRRTKRKRVQTFFDSEPSRTKQSFKEECDVNNMIRKFNKVTGVDLLKDYHQALGGKYGDFTDVVDYRTALERIDRAEQAFMALPAVLRKKFDNDPAKFVDFATDPNNMDQMVEMGLATKSKVDQETPEVPTSASTEE